MQHRRSLLACVRVFSFGTTLAFAVSCSQAERPGVPFFPERMPHASPFTAGKVQLRPDSFSGTVAGARTVTGTGKTVPGLKVVALVNNGCVKERCRLDGDSPGSLACYFAKHAERRADLPAQFFSFQLPVQMTSTELSQWAARQTCIQGISNQNVYQSESFNDTHYSQQSTALNTITHQASQAEFALSRFTPVRVAIIDSGVGLHPDFGGLNDLPGVVWREDLRSVASQQAAGCPTGYTNDNPLNPHGTFVAGIIGATRNNTTGIAGIAPNVQMISLAVGDCRGRMSTTEVGNALLTAQLREAEVINMSLGGALGDDPAVRFAIVTLLNTKAVIVSAAGNSFKDLQTDPSYPAVYSAQYPGFITVGWAKQDGSPETGDGTTWGTNYSTQHVKIAAPGTLIASTTNPDGLSGYQVLAPGYALASGSSFSTPMVSAAAALAIAYLKYNSIPYDERLIEFLILERGTRAMASLAPFVKNGALLDLQKLSQALKYLKDTGDAPQAMAVTAPSIYFNSSTNQATLEFTAGWNLNVTHLGAALGVFDAECGYSEPCLIQGFALPGAVGSQRFKLSRNELLPTLPSLTDPNFGLYINVAIYHQIYDQLGKKKNNYAVDAVARVNLRDYDMSTSNSIFTGGVSNIRFDQVNLYVQGWVCLQGSNKAAPVEILGASGSPITTSFAYRYPWMIPHSPLMDSGLHNLAPFLAQDFGMVHTGRTSHKAGLEANPLMITQCQTLTTAHGFEFGIPLSQIKSQGLTGTRFSVRATNPNLSTAKIVLKDVNQESSFVFPEVNLQPTISNDLALSRSAGNLTLGGSVCSDVPTPVHVEISYRHWSFRCRLKKQTGFPDFDDPCDTGFYRSLPLLHNAGFTNRNTFEQIFVGNDYQLHEELADLQLNPEEMATHLTTYPGLWPNLAISLWVPQQTAPALRSAMLARNIRDIASGRRVVDFQDKNLSLQDQGPGISMVQSSHRRSHEGISVGKKRNAAIYWDLYDMGEGYTPSVVAYDVDSSNTVGEYLLRTLGVTKLMREVKKYETPYMGYTFFLGNEVIKSGAPGAASCRYRFEVSKQIPLADYAPGFKAHILAFLQEGEAPTQNIEIEPDLALLMNEIPIDIRVFQDGVMIQHLLSDYGSNFTKIPTLGRGQ